MKNGVASENKNIYRKINIFILTVFINQSTDLQSKSMEWFLYDRDLRRNKLNDII